MRIDHELPEAFRSRQPVRIMVVGAGGSGSAIVLGLPYLHQAMRAWGHTHGVEVTVVDLDAVSRTNCVRQPFSVSDIGLNKAIVLVNRINLFWGLEWRAEAVPFAAKMLREYHDVKVDLLIGCVDTRVARKTIADALSAYGVRTTYWLDLGNNAASGQYVLGQPINAANRRKATRLRTVAELFPEIVDADAGEDELPSCSAIEALERQEPYINQTLAASALAMIARLFRYGRIAYHGGFYNAQTGRMTALPVDPAAWQKGRRRHRRAKQSA